MQIEVRPGLRVRVLELELLAQIKEEVGRDKDLIAVRVIRQVIAERERQRRAPSNPPPTMP